MSRFVLVASLIALAVWILPGNRLDAQAQAASPTSSKLAVPALPLNATTITPALVFDYHIPPALVQADEQSQHIAYLWGANDPPPAGASTSSYHYVAWAQGWCPGLGIYGNCPATSGPPSMPWVKKVHPDWLEWQIDKKGKPVTPAGTRWNPGPILDFTNPALQQFWIDNYLGPYLKQGFQGIDWDNPTAYNLYAAAGHYDLHHHFVRQYSGAINDPRWVKGQVQAMGDLLQRSRAINPNVGFDLADSIDCLYAPMASWLLSVRYVKTIVDEEGYSFWGSSRANYVPTTAGPYCKNRWLAKTQFYIQEQKAGKGVFLINQEPYTVTPEMTDTNSRARADLQWALANYLLVKYSKTYFWFGGFQQYGYPFLVQGEESVNLGTATGDMKPTQGVYSRTFTKGLVLVNPDPKKSFKVTLPVAKYKDLYGNLLNQVTLSPHSGEVLQTLS